GHFFIGTGNSRHFISSLRRLKTHTGKCAGRKRERRHSQSQGDVQNRAMNRGVFHVHSVFSDGEESLERLVEIFRQSGMSFAAVSDHAEVFGEGRMEKMFGFSDSLSEIASFLFPVLKFDFIEVNIT